MKRFVTSRRHALRLERAAEFLKGLPADREALIIGPSFETAAELIRSNGRSAFGWKRTTLYRLALEWAAPELLKQRLAPASPLALEAVWARVTHQLGHDGKLDRLVPLDGKPGLSRALGMTVGELRMTGVPAESLEPALREAMHAYERALRDAELIDRAGVYAIAREAVGRQPSVPVLVLDVKCDDGAERAFADAVIAHASQALITAPPGESWNGVETREELPVIGASTTALLQRNLFSTEADPLAGGQLDFFSAPGEARECVEIARRMIELSKTGVRFDQMAVLLRSPGTYRAPLEDAFRRAKIPAWFSSGLPRPDPAGRALLALLLCAEEKLSARRFSEYLSLSQVPPLVDGAPPAADASQFVRPDAAGSLLPLEAAEAPEVEKEEVVDDLEAAAVLGQLRAPRRWERLIIDAAVIGGPDRWRRRLTGLTASRKKERLNPTATEAQLARVDRELADLQALEAFALPLIDTLASFPRSARWSEWLQILRSLVSRAIKFPQRVLAVLNELAPMGPVGPIELPEVRAVLSRRLSEVTEAPEQRRHGGVLVATTDIARGLSFEAVFVPGLAERVFPQKIREDPLLSDETRVALGQGLETSNERVAAERLALTLAVGAARDHVVLSYPRVDAEHGRPRAPSFYGLEAARAVDGVLTGFEELQRRAESASNVRLAWPAPAEPTRAIDDTEFDLSLLQQLLASRDPVKGRARYLVTSNPHLGRALRARYARWQQSAWTPSDGLVKPGAAGRTALEAHQLGKRPFSPTSLEQYAACPYRFYLATLARLQPLQIPGEIEELGPLEKGSMAHQVQYELLSELRDDGIAVIPANLPVILERLHERVTSVSKEVFDRFKPAIERVWEDGVHTLEADLREWLRRATDDPSWKPAHFELSFGLPGRDVDAQDPRSTPDPVTLAESLKVRGSIDLVEVGPGGRLRATDYKTGRARAEEGNVIGGGRHLQPLLYALVLEQRFPEAKVDGGRLYYTTQLGGFTSVETPLNESTREEFGMVARTLREALETGFFPAAPDEGECKWCDFKSVCGPNEERRVMRTGKYRRADLEKLHTLRARK